MSESIERPHSRAQKLAYLVAISAIFLLICTFLQWKSGAYSNDLAGNDDEPAHVVSGLMAHDYVEHLLRPGNSHWPSTPRAFAEDYYVHYPKVAIGHWPPLFYLVEAVWMFVFGRTKAALLALMAVTMAGTASILFQLTRKIAGEIAAFVLAAGFLLLPISQESVESVMQDGLLALLFCGATIAGGRALESRRGAWVRFWLLTIAAMSVNGRGAALLPALWIAIPLARRTDVLKRPAFWIATALALFLAAPWFLFDHQTKRLSLAPVVSAATAFPIHAVQCLGPVLFATMVLGAVLAPYRKEPRWAFVTGVLLGTWALFSVAIVPWDDRYFLFAALACMILIAIAVRILADAVSKAFKWPPMVTVVFLAAIVTGASMARALPLSEKPAESYESFIAQILAGPDGSKPVYLVAGDERHEGGFIAAAALEDPEAKHIVLRATKVLAFTDWGMAYYRPLFKSSTDMVAYLNQSWISLVVIQEDCARPDAEMLRAAMIESKWSQLPAPSGTLVYRRTTPLPPGQIRIRLDMRTKLGKYLEATP